MTEEVGIAPLTEGAHAFARVVALRLQLLRHRPLEEFFSEQGEMPW